ncbi:TPA: enolase, partial [Streptococcus pneumoniae]
MKIINGICRYIFDSKGFATIEVEIFLDSGDTGIGAAPRGSTTGHYDIQYNEYYPRGNNFSPIPDGNIEFFNENILPRIINREVEDIEDITELDKHLFDIPEIENYGNVAIACSYAVWEAFSKNKKSPLWKLFFEPGSASKGKVKHLVNIIDGKPDSLLAGFEFLLVSEKEITFQSLL